LKGVHVTLVLVRRSFLHGGFDLIGDNRTWGQEQIAVRPEAN